jgi:glutathione S-transferase
MTLKIYDSERSPNARKVRLLAAELGISLERIPLDFAKGDLRAPDYLDKNPNGTIPTIDDEGFVLWESAAVLLYLAAQKPERDLLPRDAKERALLDQWMFWYAAHVDSAFLLLAFEKVVKSFLGQPNDEAVIRAAQTRLDRFLAVLETQLEGKDHVLGKLTIADFQMAPWFDTAPRLGLDLSAYPNISRWLETLRKKPYWSTA